MAWYEEPETRKPPFLPQIVPELGTVGSPPQVACTEVESSSLEAKGERRDRCLYSRKRISG